MLSVLNATVLPVIGILFSLSINITFRPELSITNKPPKFSLASPCAFKISKILLGSTRSPALVSPYGIPGAKIILFPSYANGDPASPVIYSISSP